MSVFFGLSVSTIAVNGTTSVCPATETAMPSSTASVSGRLIENVEPRPGRDEIEMRPPSAWMDRFTTSMPTPRPEIFEIVEAVENPGRNRRLSISLSVSCASAGISPFLIAEARTLGRSIPAPSSAISMTIRPERWAAVSRTKPSAGLPAASRCSGDSMP